MALAPPIDSLADSLQISNGDESELSSPHGWYQDHRQNDNSKQLTHKDYTVGWICALPKEQTAATAMLDEVHPPLPKTSSDGNSYTLGQIGEHNIVIACLPKNRYGTNTAAKAAAWMTSTFTSIRVGLLVGIAGGIPFKVKLGDVVVTTNIVQWDMGKAEEGGRFKHTGTFNSPPTALLTAVSKLETQHAMFGSKIPHHIMEMTERYPRLKAQYAWNNFLEETQPASEEPFHVHRSFNSLLLELWHTIIDLILYFIGWGALDINRSRLQHVADEALPTGLAGPDWKPPSVDVLYGLIASGNQVIKDAKVRERLDELFGGEILCIEMEAAGLMNDFPCVVIRGICDFADARKNKMWQEYAAAAAAGCAKELLGVIDAVDIEQTPEARIVTTQLRNLATETRLIADRQEQHIQEQDKLRKDHKLLQLFHWLSDLRPSAQHIENQRQRVKGSGIWLLEDSRFIDWRDSVTHTVLCCYGKPGAGKTILTSVVIDSLGGSAPKGDVGIAYIYCDYQDQGEQTLVNVLGSFLRQLLEQTREISAGVWDLYQERCEKRLKLTLVDANHLLSVICGNFGRVYLCVDALDEFKNPRDFLQFFQARPVNVSLFLTGRTSVQSLMESTLAMMTTIYVRAQKDDIARFIESEIGGVNDAEPAAMDEALHAKMIGQITASARGIFLLPVLQTRAVLQNLTIRQREDALKSLPSDLGEAYQQTFNRIQQQSSSRRARAAHIIAWVHLATRPITVDQLLCSLLIQKDDKDLDLRGLPVRETLLDSCHGLVITDRETSTVRLVHYSLDFYLQHQEELLGNSKIHWHDRMAVICLVFLRLKRLQTSVEAKLLHRAFFRYASTQWGHHLRLSNEHEVSTTNLANAYLQMEGKEYLPDHQLLYRHIYGTSLHSTKLLSGHMAAYFGLTKSMLHLLSNGFEVETPDHRNGTILELATNHGHRAMVQLLIDHGAQIIRINSEGDSPLLIAASGGHVEVVQLLLSHEADVHQRNNTGETPLSVASFNGHWKIVQLLLEHQAEVNCVDEKGRTSLYGALGNHNIQVLQLLLSHGARVNQADNFGLTPLGQALSLRRMDMATILIDHGADVNGLSVYGRTALSVASSNGDKEMALLLVRHGAEVNMHGKNGMTALSMAALMGDKEMTKLLLSHGAHVDMASTHFMEPEEAQKPSADLSMNGDTVLDQMYQCGRTALGWATLGNHKEVVQQLLSYGADMNLIDDYGNHAVLLAPLNGDLEVLQLLLSHGPYLDYADIEGRTLLLRAANFENTDLLQLLISKGADVNHVDNAGCSPLSIATRHGDGDSAKLLIDQGAKVDQVDNYGATPLMLALYYGRDKKLLNLLISEGANVNHLDNDGSSPLHYATEICDPETIDLLLEHGAEVNITNTNGYKPLDFAFANDANDVIERLTQHGGKQGRACDYDTLLIASMNRYPWRGVKSLTTIDVSPANAVSELSLEAPVEISDSSSSTV